ncbi:MAG: hypothetical protein ACFFAJ_04180 [Candidatus Hodarchaeota archaeon]
MSFFKKRRIRKFAEKAIERQNSIFVFGSNIFAEAFIDKLIEIGAQSKVALISNKKLAWTEEVKEQVNVLIEEKKEEYAKRNLYENIGFQNAEKVIILHEDPVMIQDIMSFVSTETADLKVILLAQFAPPFVKYLARQKEGQILIVDNLFQIVRELYQQMKLTLDKPPVISIPIPKISRPLNELNIPSVRVLSILREDAKQKIIPLEEQIQENDRLLLYLEDPELSLKNLVDFLNQK